MESKNRLKGTLNFVVALPLEAKSITEHFDLQLASVQSPFRVYTNADNSLCLIVSGVGKVSAATATAFVAARSGANPATAWLNIGVAGHKNLPIGTLILAHKITDTSRGRSWYPPQILDTPCQTKALLTVDEEIHDYPDDAVCEMEASGFYQTASRYTTHELIHCVKIISDNEENETIEYGGVEGLIRENLDTIHSIVYQLLDISAEQSDLSRPSPYFELFMQQWHFTVTQQHQLQKFLSRWTVLFPEEDPLRLALKETGNAKQVLAYLEEKLDSTSVLVEDL